MAEPMMTAFRMPGCRRSFQGQGADSLFSPALDYLPSRALRNKEDDHKIQKCRHDHRAEHSSPHFFFEQMMQGRRAVCRGLCRILNPEIDQIRRQEADRYGELIKRDQSSPLVCGRHLGNVNRCDNGNDSYSYTSCDTETYQLREIRTGGAADRTGTEQSRGYKHCLFPAYGVAQGACDCHPEYRTDQGASDIPSLLHGIQ